tara:strand:- start:1115 stop:1807 length:693 start_codon:yes stop_codon:yes gene_type:complete
MIAYSIVIKDNETSETGFNNLVESSKKVGNDFEIEKFKAVTPPDVKEVLQAHKLQWNYPWEGTVTDFSSGLTKRAYQTRSPKARVACALSHYRLWNLCANTNKSILILEHDAVFTTALDFNMNDSKFNILGINNPIGCTFKSRDYYQTILNDDSKEQSVPRLAPANVPQGLAGNSAYIIKPAGANKLISLVKEFGLWPNDAIMCYQLVPKLGVTRKFYTGIQTLKSTTTQ